MAIPKRRRGGSVERLPSGRYKARWYTPDGRHPSKTFTLKADAERYLRRVIVQQEQEGVGLAPRHETLASLIDPWWATVERSVKPRTVERYTLHLEAIRSSGVASRPLGELGYADVQSFVDELSERYAPRTVRGAYGVLALILKDGQRRGKLVRQIPLPRLPRVGASKLVIPTRDEVEQFAEMSDARLTAAVLLAGYCGPRQGELLALQRDDVNLAEGWVFIHQARNKTSGRIESTKTDKARRVYLPARVRGVLEEHLDEYEGAALFPVTASVFDKSWRSARLGAGMTGVRFHDLRHAAASMMIASGWSVLQVSKQLGHANATMTLNVYGHLWPDSFQDAVAKMDAYLAQD